MDLKERGFVTADSVRQQLQWDGDRVQQALEHLVRDGICWIDTQCAPAQYWIMASHGVI